MKPLWSPVAKTLAAGCDQLRATFHGKEGVDGSSPSENWRADRRTDASGARNSLQTPTSSAGLQTGAAWQPHARSVPCLRGADTLAEVMSAALSQRLAALSR